MVDLELFRKGKIYSKWRNRFYHQGPVKIYSKLTHDEVVLWHYAGKKIMKPEQTNAYIYESIMNNNPIMVSRFGGTESGNIEKYYLDKIHNREPGEDTLVQFQRLQSLSGFFPNDISMLERFCEVYLKAAESIDLLATWNMAVEPYAIWNMKKSARLTTLQFIEPWFYEHPWTAALENKKVLIVHPFADSIEKQYRNREKLFDNIECLPPFELLTFKAVQTIAGEKDERFDTWFSALEYMKQAILPLDFDVAIIGCGAYGMPLAAAIRETSRTAIHLAGVTQLMFGIWGNRWNQSGPSWEKYKKLRNNYWISPSKEETPVNAEVVEAHTYW